ncbi:MAG: LPS assembly lipoprotein LptE [Phycisphaerae bacterium]
MYVKMFDNKSFERGVEYDLTDALAKRIEAETPYKVVSSIDRADSVISGYIANAGRGVLTTERETGRPMEKEIVLTARVDWKNLKTGQYLLEGQEAIASASWSEWQNQGIEYSSALAANKLAERIVELMETSW